jgi:hypothetical protein
VKPVASLPIRSEGTELCSSYGVSSHEVSQTPVTPGSSQALSCLLTLIRQDLHDEPSRGRHQKLIQKVANTVHTSFVQRALDRNHIEFLSNMNSGAKRRRKTKSGILGKGRVMIWEDIVVQPAKRAEQKAAAEARGKQKRGTKPKRSATAADEPSEAIESVEAAEVAEVSLKAQEGEAGSKRSHSRNCETQ